MNLASCHTQQEQFYQKLTLYIALLAISEMEKYSIKIIKKPG